jgi:hypothetical protein
MPTAMSVAGSRRERHPEPVAQAAQALPNVESATAYLAATDSRALSMATGSVREQAFVQLQRERGNTFVQRMVAAGRPRDSKRSPRLWRRPANGRPNCPSLSPH